MESHHRVANDTTSSQVFSSLGGFAVQTDWIISGPKHCETTSDFSPSLKPDVDADVKLELLDDCHNS